MRRLIYFLIIGFSIYFIYTYRENIIKFYNHYFVSIESKVSKLEKNEYYRDADFSYVQNTTNFIPKNKQDILNIYYTVVNSGMTDFTFYCDYEYKDCFNDINDFSNNQDAISNISNFVHPFNSFKKIGTDFDSTGKANIHIEKLYDDEMIIILNYKVDEIIKKNITDNMTVRQKIKKIHDYIINHTSYDSERSDKKVTNYKSDNAYGVLIEGKGLCGGYSDAMMLFLERFNIPSIKITTENHAWNYVKIDNEWLHLDLTWDDPVTSNGKDILDDSYFLINDSQLKTIEKEDHNYNKEVYEQK